MSRVAVLSISQFPMPTYEYACAKCGHEMEAFQSMKDAPLRKCPACGKASLKRKVSAGAGLIFKGSGFYINDYKKKSSADKESPEPKTPAKPAETKTAETKPAETKPAAPVAAK